MPCWELFDKQTLEYRHSVLQPGTTTVAVEAAVAMGWERYLGSKGGFVGMTGYGASGPAEALYSHFDITVQSVVDLALRLHNQ